ncbi:Uncharacterized protein dnm_026430 [Desulfonema magnum]|uniref:Uncharacterized protein n=1 Tax=Desulfonema magnum TaxID=45655 RepID=A0A975BK98_9BACT|nr:Uncharacterized protein dnm_026430 [Desulfonema magnum]
MFLFQGNIKKIMAWYLTLNVRYWSEACILTHRGASRT